MASKSYLNAIEFCWYREMFKIFYEIVIGLMLIMCYIILVFSILPLSYQIDLRKLRFYHAKYTAASVGATSKRTVGMCRLSFPPARVDDLGDHAGVRLHSTSC